MSKSKSLALVLLLVFALFVSACSKTAVAKEAPPTKVAEREPEGNPYAKWIDALALSGATVEAVDEVLQPFFTVKGQVVRINGHAVQLFIYESESAAKAEAKSVSPDGMSVGTSIMMWMATPHFYQAEEAIALYIGDDAATLELLEVVFGAQFAGGQAAARGDEIGDAALAGLAEIGWDITGFAAETRAVDGDYATVTITSTNPPGGFSAFMIRQDGQWTVAAHGSAYNPEHLEQMGFPLSVLR